MEDRKENMDRHISRSKRRKIDNDLVSTSQNIDKGSTSQKIDKAVDKVGETSPVLSVSEKIRHFTAISGDIGRVGKRSASRTSLQSDITKNDVLSERLFVSRKAAKEENSATDVRRLQPILVSISLNFWSCRIKCVFKQI